MTNDETGGNAQLSMANDQWVQLDAGGIPTPF
jgi:hypothetical protein